jgi:hypothetical protein
MPVRALYKYSDKEWGVFNSPNHPKMRTAGRFLVFCDPSDSVDIVEVLFENIYCPQPSPVRWVEKEHEKELL